MESKKENYHIFRKPIKKPITKEFKGGGRDDTYSGKEEFYENDYIQIIDKIKSSASFTVQGKRESIFSIEIFDKTPTYFVDSILEYFNAELVSFLSQTKFLVRCEVNSIDKIEEDAKQNRIAKKFKLNIKKINIMSVDEKISSTLKKYSQSSDISAEKIKIMGLLMPKFEMEEYKELLSKLKDDYPNEEITEIFSIDNKILIFSAYVSANLIEKIASESIIYRLSEKPELTITPTSVHDFDTYEIVDTKEDLPSLCIIDSGVNNKIFNNLIIDYKKEPYIPNFDDIIGHGTKVSSVSIFGDDILDNKQKIIPQCKIYAYKIDVFNGGMFPFAVMNAIEQFKNQTKIFNLSVNYTTYNRTIAELNNIIDNYVRENNVILVNSCGNILQNEIQLEYDNQNLYPKYLRNYSCSGPSTSKNIFAVGSFTKYESKNSLSKIGQISPYSRIGNTPDIRDQRIKPDILSVGGGIELNGGNIKRNPNIELNMIDKNGQKTKDIGTSFSAPYIASLLSTLSYKYPDIKNMETLKAILLSKCDILSFNNKPLLKLTQKKEDVCLSNREVLYYSEGYLNPKYYDNSIKSHVIDRDRINFYIPANTESVKIFIVHSSDYEYSTHYQIDSHINTKIFKAGRQNELTSRDSEKWFLDNQSPINYVEFHMKKGQRGIWDLVLSTDSKKGKEYKIRYGVAINLSFYQKLDSHNNEYEEIIDELNFIDGKD